MPPGRYNARHITQWSVLVASCKATRCHYLACACAVLARRTPWSLPSPSCQNTNNTQLLASNYRTFILANLSTFVTGKGPSTHIIDATRFVTMWDNTIQEEAISYISSYQTLTSDKNSKQYEAMTKLVKKSGCIYATIAVKLFKAASICIYTACQCTQTLSICLIWMWESVCGGCQPHLWCNDIILTPQATQNHKICTK